MAALNDRAGVEVLQTYIETLHGGLNHYCVANIANVSINDHNRWFI